MTEVSVEVNLPEREEDICPEQVAKDASPPAPAEEEDGGNSSIVPDSSIPDPSSGFMGWERLLGLRPYPRDISGMCIPFPGSCIVMAIFRSVVFVNALVALLVGMLVWWEYGGYNGSFFVYFSDTSFMLLVLYFFLASMISISASVDFIRKKLQPLSKLPSYMPLADGSAQDGQLYFINVIITFLLPPVAVAAILLSIVYWTLLFQPAASPEEFYADVSFHGFNAVSIALELLLGAVPWHVLSGLCFSLLYMLGYLLFFALWGYWYGHWIYEFMAMSSPMGFVWSAILLLLMVVLFLVLCGAVSLRRCLTVLLTRRYFPLELTRASLAVAPSSDKKLPRDEEMEECDIIAVHVESAAVGDESFQGDSGEQAALASLSE